MKSLKSKNINPKIIFIGTPEFAAIVLEKLYQENLNPQLVITSSDKPVGRKGIITAPPVKDLAQKHKAEILQPKKISDIKDKISAFNPDLIIVVAYKQILPKDILSIPKFGCLNIHPSLLPKYRGPSPIQYAILEGEKETGVSIILMDEKIDHGKIVSSIKHQISSSDNYKELSEKLSNLGANLLIETIPDWIKGKIKPIPQDESRATYTKIIKKEDGKINWEDSAQKIERKVRAFYPWPSAFAFLKEESSSEGVKTLKILEAEVLEQTKNGPFGVPGKVYIAPDDKIAVQTGKDFLIVKKLQLQGKSPTNSADFLKGHIDFIGKILK